MKLIPDRLKECREIIGISKQEASKRLGLSQPAYLRYESGDRTPSPQVIKEIAKTFHTSVDYLIGESDDSTQNIIEVQRENDEELFLIIQTASDFKISQKKRLLKYAEKLSEQE